MKKTKAESNPNERVPGHCSLTVMLSPYKSQMGTIHESVIQGAMQNPIWVLDMGNCFNTGNHRFGALSHVGAAGGPFGAAALRGQRANLRRLVDHEGEVWRAGGRHPRL